MKGRVQTLASYESVSPTEPLWFLTNLIKYGVIIASNRDTDTYIHIHTSIHTYRHIYTNIYDACKYIHIHTHVLAPGGVLDTGIASYIGNINANTCTYRHIHAYYMHSIITIIFSKIARIFSIFSIFTRISPFSI